MTNKLHQSWQGRLDWRVVLLSIAGFWLFYFFIVTLRTWVVDIPAQGELAYRRAIVTGIGMAITAAQWLMMRPFDRSALGTRIATAVIIAMPCALAVTLVNYYIFNVFDPTSLMDIEKLKPPHEYKASLSMEIAEVAITRYFFLIAWAALYLALGFADDVRIAERRASEFARAAQTAELRALRYQVNPHFLFNTLNSLSALVLRGRREEAESMIMNLSTFYRTSLSGEPSEDVPLHEEIALQRLYLDIETVRFPERLVVEIDVPELLSQKRVPGLILQPLVENAVKYGVSRTLKPVTIRISARMMSEKLIVEVCDTGAGPVTTPEGNGHGIGLANVRDRLTARFGSAASLETGPSPDGGWCAVLTLPGERA